MSLGPENRSRGYGTVLMGSREDAARAIGKLLIEVSTKAYIQIDTMDSRGRLERLKYDLIDYHQSTNPSNLST